MIKINDFSKSFTTHHNQTREAVSGVTFDVKGEFLGVVGKAAAINQLY